MKRSNKILKYHQPIHNLQLIQWPFVQKQAEAAIEEAKRCSRIPLMWSSNKQDKTQRPKKQIQGGGFMKDSLEIVGESLDVKRF